MSSNSVSSRWRITTAEGSPSQEELVTKQMMPLPVCSAMRRSATRKNRMYRSSSLFLVMSQFSARPSLYGSTRPPSSRPETPAKPL